MSKPMNIRAVARACGVSPATVSRAIRGTAPVREETRCRIVRYMAESGCAPPPRPAEKPAGGTVIVLLPEWNQPFYTAVLQQVQRRLDEKALSLAVLPEQTPQLARLLRTLAPCGALLLNEDVGAEIPLLLQQNGIPTVMCGAQAPGRAFPAVHIDDLAAAYDGTNYLLQLGHRHIGFLTDSPRSISTGFQRIAGCRRALEEHGLSPDERLFFSRAGDYASGYDGARALLRQEPELTALFAHSDAAAAGALAALRDLGLRVPQDVSLLGFDGTALSSALRPRLSCLCQPIAEMTNAALTLLEQLGRAAPDETCPSYTFPHSLAVRDSCAAPAGAAAAPVLPDLEENT